VVLLVESFAGHARCNCELDATLFFCKTLFVTKAKILALA
jgi:hypothetical protein|tara:strand:+ start:548 stop:667 length:120 start_codon:yes stop_codon:yes gene_type:complete